MITIIAAVVWFGLGFIAAGWAFADLTRHGNWAQDDCDFLFCFCTFIMGPIGLIAAFIARLDEVERYGWMLPRPAPFKPQRGGWFRYKGDSK